MRYLILIALLTGCSSFQIQEPPKVLKVEIPISTSCVKQEVKKPAFKTDSDLLDFNGYSFGMTLFAERSLYIGYVAELEAIIEGCK